MTAWFDPTDPRMWSGVPSRLIKGLDDLGVFDGVHDVTPWRPASRLARRWIQATRRPDDGWPLRSEMRLLAAASTRWHRRRTPPGVDGWIHPAMGTPRAVRGRVVTLSEMSPSQLVQAGPLWAASFGYPGATPAMLRAVARQQEEAHCYARACCVASRWAGDSLVRDHGVAPDKVHVIGYGPNAEPAAPRERDWSAPRFLFVGRDWDRKNGDAVVRAFARLRQEVPDATLDVVGRHREIEVDGVIGHGLLAVTDPEGRARMEQLFARATCFVMPSLMEPFGIVYVEAAAAGIPSIATTVGGTMDSVGDGGILVDPADEHGLYEAMRRVARPEEARALGHAARQRAGRLTWARAAQRLLRAFDLVDAEEWGLAPFL